MGGWMGGDRERERKRASFRKLALLKRALIFYLISGILRRFALAIREIKSGLSDFNVFRRFQSLLPANVNRRFFEKLV